MALFGEVLLIGALVTALGLALVTLPAAVAAGVQHLRRFVRGEDSRLGLYWRDARVALPGGLALGAVCTLAAVLLLGSLWIALTAPVPARDVIVVVCGAGLWVLGILLLAVSGAWSAEGRWRRAWPDALTALRGDPVGAALYAAAVGLVVLLTWVLPPLIIPGIGCAALAVVAIPVRRRRMRP